jgi:hypothetical protein
MTLRFFCAVYSRLLIVETSAKNGKMSSPVHSCDIVEKEIVSGAHWRRDVSIARFLESILHSQAHGEVGELHELEAL